MYVEGDVGTIESGPINTHSGIFVEGSAESIHINDMQGTLARGSPEGTRDFVDIQDLLIHGEMRGDVYLGAFSTAEFTGDTYNPVNPCLDITSQRSLHVKEIPANRTPRVYGGGWITIGATPTSPSTLAGQVVFNSGNAFHDAAFYATVAPLGPLGDPFGDPDYPEPSSALGGGAIGLVPYALYNNDCFPVHTAVDEWDTTPGTSPLLNTQFCHRSGTTARDVYMTFYGPIASATTGAPVSVWIWLHQGYWKEVTDLCDFDIVGRSVKISGRDEDLLPPGYYAVLAPTTGSDRLHCQSTLVTPAPSVMYNIMVGENNDIPVVQYNFYLFADCDEDDVFDGTGDPDCGPCVADYDDGTSTGTPDGGVTVDDLLYYLDLFEDGNIHADVDDGSATGITDSAVTIDDLLYYLIHFENGC